MQFGDRLVESRKKRKLTRQEFAELTGLSVESVGRYERNERAPDIDKARVMAEVLGVTIAYLTDGIMSPEEKAVFVPKSEAAEMFARLMKKLAAENPDLIVHFRDLDKNIENLTLEDVQGIADGIAMITGQATEEIEKRMKRKSRHGDL